MAPIALMLDFTFLPLPSCCLQVMGSGTAYMAHLISTTQQCAAPVLSLGMAADCNQAANNLVNLSLEKL
jgi:hypothetical protein